MSRKHCRRQVIVPLPPRGLRPKLAREQKTDLALHHLQLLDDIAHGRGNEAVMWQMVASVLTWYRAAELMDVGLNEMRPLLELITRLVERFGRTGKVGFSGSEYLAAKMGVDLMDMVAEAADQLTASAAADWSEAQVNKMAAARRSK